MEQKQVYYENAKSVFVFPYNENVLLTVKFSGNLTCFFYTHTHTHTHRERETHMYYTKNACSLSID